MLRVINSFFLTLLISLLAGRLLNAQGRTYVIPPNAKHVPETIVVKLKNPDQSSLQQRNDRHLNMANLSDGFPIIRKEGIQYDHTKSKSRSKRIESKFLSNIYKLALTKGSDLSLVINQFLQYDNVQYAEPIYYEQLLVVPNDPNIGLQDHLPVIKAYEAWDITQGSSDITIGIIDSGMQLDHQDLQNQIAPNATEIVNSIDDDGNGFVDDVNGWDFADADNDPTADTSPHGTRVAGIAGAQTNNAIGVAGVGYNSRIVPLKIFRTSDDMSANSYDAIIYAADQGYDIINLSWGSVGTFSQFNQDVINYAAVEKNVVVVAAAGNTDAELDFYPASYDNVLSVGATDVNDNKSSFATYSYHIDIMAPGVAVYSTTNGNSYNTANGSSFSAPQVAGAAALVKSIFPDLNALQVMQQLRITSDDIYSVGDNNQYNGQLGKGRLNVLRAVTESSSPAIRMEGLTYSGTFGEKIYFDDTVTVKMNFINYLRATINAQASITTESSYVTFLSSDNFSIGSLNEMESLNDQELILHIDESAPPSERLLFKVAFTDDSGYEDFQYFVIELEPDYLSIENNSLKFTVSSNGNLGYAIDTLENGNGFQFKGVKIADQFGIIVANHQDSVSNNVINDYTEFVRDTSFLKQSNLKPIEYEGTNLYSISTFEDSNETVFGLGLSIEQEILAWNDSENEEYIILEYRVSNASTKQKNNLEFGFYADWNLADAFENKADWDGSINLGYVYDGANDKDYAGIALLTNQTPNYHAIDVRSENGNTSEIDNDFTKSKKYDFITNSKLTAGDIGTGNDVANLLGTTIGALDPGAYQKIAFVLTAGQNLADLQANVLKAQAKYSDFIDTPPITLIDTACINEVFTLNTPNGSSFEIYDDSQMSNLLMSGTDLNLGIFTKDSIIYYRIIEGNLTSDISGLQLLNNDPAPNFILETDTLYVGDDPLNRVQFTDTSGDALTWQWDFDNGTFATIPNPLITFTEARKYQIELTISSSAGCNGVVSKELLVAERSPEPTISDQTICKSESVTISATDATNLKFYLNESDTNPVFEGSEFVSGEIDRDTVFYVSSVDATFESHKVSVNVTIDPIQSDYSVKLDTLDLSEKSLLIFENLSQEAASIEWFVDNTSIGSDPEQDFTFSDQTSITIKQKVKSSLECLDSLSQTIDLAISPKPELADTIEVCRFDSTKVIPSGGNVFYFYSDKAKTNLIHKGTTLKSGPLEKDSLIFITNVSDFRESDIDSVLFEVIPFETEITASPEFLIIEEGRNVQFSSNNEDITKWKWFVEGKFVETVPSPILKFDTTGVYDVQLIATSTDGCLDTTNLAYEVRHITALPDFSTKNIIVYPNPARNTLIIQNNNEIAIQNLRMYNSLGAEISLEIHQENNSYQMDISELPAGMYLIKGQIGNQFFNSRVLIDR